MSLDVQVRYNCYCKDVYDIDLANLTSYSEGLRVPLDLQLEDYLLFGRVAAENMNFQQFHAW